MNQPVHRRWPGLIEAYRDRLPVAANWTPVTLLEGGTPLIHARRISEMTGGRILPGDPNSAELYERSALEFPRTYLPLTRPLLLAWVIVMLLDVAVRRVVIDFRGILRKLARARKISQSETEQMISQLRAKRKQVQDKMTTGAVDAAKRYDAADRADTKLPGIEVKQAEPVKEKKDKTPPPAKPSAGEDRSHIDRLLRAKRKASGDGNQPGDSQDR